MKRIVVFFLILTTLLLSGCGIEIGKADQLMIVTTIFPPYDFARAITGGQAEIVMLLKPGCESHSYEPSPQDILLVEDCDLFIYNGGESDTWVDTILESVDVSKKTVIKMMDCVEGLSEEHHHHEHEENHAPVAEYDEHIWTSPVNAKKVTSVILDAVTELNQPKKEMYQSNAQRYLTELDRLDREFREIVAKGDTRTMIFGDRFPFRYFAEEYGLSYYAAFSGCSGATEPAAKTVAFLIDKVKDEEISNTFYIEFSNQRIAKTIEEETGAKPLLFHSCHNLTATEMKQGVTYLDLMWQNSRNLKEALSRGNYEN